MEICGEAHARGRTTPDLRCAPNPCFCHERVETDSSPAASEWLQFKFRGLRRVGGDVLIELSHGDGDGYMKRRSEADTITSGVLIACWVPVCVSIVAAATAAERTLQIPAALEPFQLHSACASVGQQILEGNFIGSALYQEQFSRFNPRTNHCYVEMRVQTADLNKHSDRFARYLYDGQTREMLAFAQIQNGKKSGRVYDLHHRTASFENAGWDDASEYIYAMMTDDRR